MRTDNLTFYNKFLKSKRGWVSKWPKKTVFIYSGGMDSTITIARMLEKKKLEIYPLFINRGQSNEIFEKESALFFNDYFTKRYPNLYHNLFEIKIDVPPGEIKNELRPYSKVHGYPLRNTVMQLIGVQYAVSLLSDGNLVKSVMCAQVSDDPFPHSTLSSLRINTINTCDGLNEWDWQITSPNIDPELNETSIGKVDMIKFANSINLPIEKTRSCYTDGNHHCGKCLTCSRRKAAFKEAGVIDKTDYLK